MLRYRYVGGKLLFSEATTKTFLNRISFPGYRTTAAPLRLIRKETLAEKDCYAISDQSRGFPSEQYFLAASFYNFLWKISVLTLDFTFVVPKYKTSRCVKKLSKRLL